MKAHSTDVGARDLSVGLGQLSRPRPLAALSAAPVAMHAVLPERQAPETEPALYFSAVDLRTRSIRATCPLGGAADRPCRWSELAGDAARFDDAHHHGGDQGD